MNFDPDPAWLPEVHARLSECYPVHAVRTGWDYGSNAVFRRWREFSIRIDFSALPGAIVFTHAGIAPLTVDWRRCPERPYFPSDSDYQMPAASSNGLLELPITQFPSEPLRALRRLGWRILNGNFDLRGVTRCTRLLTESWPRLPATNDFGVWAFFYHPEELANGGGENLIRNVNTMREAGAEFITASEADAYLRSSRAATPAIPETKV